MRILTTIDTIWMNVVRQASSKWTSQISYEAVASPPRALSDWAVLIYFVPIATEYFGPLATVHAHIDDDRHNMDECSAAGQLKMDLSDQLQGCASPPRALSDWAVLIYFVPIATEYFGPLATAHAHAHIDDDRHNMDECSAASQLKMDLSDHLLCFCTCGVASSLHLIFRCVAIICFYSSFANYCPTIPEVAHAHIDDVIHVIWTYLALLVSPYHTLLILVLFLFGIEGYLVHSFDFEC